MSIGLKNGLVLKRPVVGKFSPLKMVRSRKFTDSKSVHDVRLMNGVWLFRRVKKELKVSIPYAWVHMRKMSSINRRKTRGLWGLSSMALCSSLLINMFA